MINKKIEIPESREGKIQLLKKIQTGEVKPADLREREWIIKMNLGPDLGETWEAYEARLNAERIANPPSKDMIYLTMNLSA